MNFHLTLKSSNAKTGPIPVSTTGRDSCPDSCPLKLNGCYADNYHLALHWDKVTDGTRGGSLADLTRHIKRFPPGQLWRHNQAGDLPGTSENINADDLARLARANRGRSGFTYTHKSMDVPGNLDAVRAANDDGFTINLSANGPEHADRLADLELPVVTIMPRDADKVSYTPAGRKIVTCPAITSDKVTCATCGLCAKGDRSYVIGFPVHGSGASKAETVIGTES